MNGIKDRNLYLVLSEECGRGRPATEIAGLAVSGGIDMLQMREKNKSGPELKKLGRELFKICSKSGVKFIVNDDPVLAKELKADGVHLGQEDLKKYSLEAARSLIGPDKIIGVSTHSLEQFNAANDSDADYIAFGPIFPTKTKDYFIGTENIGAVLMGAKKPVVFIGGIKLANIDGILQKGARNIALIRAITEADDIAAAAANFKSRLTGVN
ncbi:MAG: thiamine phosphate synthase [Candidatus Omnitrophica bacterium]|nr:thiamine phosphate synthase [Candidatus Omnitrophota bacterium]